MTRYVPQSIKEKTLKGHITQQYYKGDINFEYNQLISEIVYMEQYDQINLSRLRRILKNKYNTSVSRNTLRKWVNIYRSEKEEVSEP